MASDTSYGEHGKASKGGKGAKKKDLIKHGLPENWVKNKSDDRQARGTGGKARGTGGKTKSNSPWGNANNSSVNIG